ncbi:hypothetical protein [Corynebacterium argentoratense]|uniref:hypothetical protein n=1 Tax=Corynebacterium argentoratense TaxID=42817 RepID=UPI0028D6F1E9|nr:hypothetical protein [Corynebacterium argentoratense]
MGKRNNKWARQPARPLPTDGVAYFGTQVQEGPSWDWGQPYLVRYMGAAAAKKTYICPGCNQTIPPGIRHVVAWPQQSGRGGDDRRHWHSACWNRR